MYTPKLQQFADLATSNKNALEFFNPALEMCIEVDSNITNPLQLKSQSYRKEGTLFLAIPNLNRWRTDCRSKPVPNFVDK
ncbi:hypothetical protein AVEN_56652-1 [Araneus ventricosus]|uniref:Uncharacterized protein n=1 Tax=Araneus ventricosus TaxID=182803 RepID=A0A4Y2WZL0_ARAVE|nr:hypothetical protein AVEN_56652-1 [Araneus ventricosus]